MFEYKPFEMHAHTLHSDGTFTADELCRACKAWELAGVLLTDHNTLSAYDELSPELERETLPVIHGIEWTTFYGHLLVIGADKYVDWRLATPDNIDTYTTQIQQANGAVGIAHPCAPGSPFCTGCHWDFNIKDWRQVNYIEVWSGPFPLLEPYNEPGFQWWTDLLNKGHRLAASSGRDWHGPDEGEPQHMPATYLGLARGEVNTLTAREALRAGRVYVTGGPEISLSLTQEGRRFGLGDTAKAGEAEISVTLDNTARMAQWAKFGIRARQLDLVQNGAPVVSIPLNGDEKETVRQGISLWPGWLRLEVMGDYLGKADQLLAFTSPVYVEERYL